LALGSQGAIWLWDLSAETLTLFTQDVEGGSPAWTPDGRRLAHRSGSDFVWRESNVTGTSELLAQDPGSPGSAAPTLYFFAPDETALVFRDQSHPETNDDLVMLSLVGDSVVRRLDADFIERNGELSPDGRWMAYESEESETPEIYVRPFPDWEVDRVQVSNGGGVQPLWSRDGRELFYLTNPSLSPQLMAVSVDADSTERFVYGERRLIMNWPYFAVTESRSYDVSPDGERFLAIKVPGAGVGGTTSDIEVVLNWFDELAERTGDP
jgi:Tol biopolymer transport system component